MKRNDILMSNEEAIERIKDHKFVHKLNEPTAIYISKALDMAIKALEQEPKSGHWIKDDFTGIIKCDICNNDAPISTVSGEQYCSYYCSCCGAKMIDPQESEDKNV